MTQMFPSHKSLLSRSRILKHIEDGNIIVDPFDRRNVGAHKYEVTLGKYYYRAIAVNPAEVPSWTPRIGQSLIYNPFDQNHVESLWTLNTAATSATVQSKLGWTIPLNNIDPEDRIILIMPGETILGHTHEFIGSADNIATSMQVRNVTSRNFIEVCKCLPPHTKIRMADGTTKAIEDVEVGDKVINVDKHGNAKTTVVKKQWKSSNKKVIRVKTRKGRVLEASEDHYLRVSRPDGVHTIQMKNLRMEDRLPVLRKWRPEYDSEMSAEEVTLLGYFITLGNFYKGRLVFRVTEEYPALRDEIESLIRTVFPEASKSVRYCRILDYRCDKLAGAFEKKYSELATKTRERRLPKQLFATSIDNVKLFFSVYLERAGRFHTVKRNLLFFNRSSGMIKDLAFLSTRLNAVPILSSILRSRANTTGLYYAYYSGADVDSLHGGQGGRCAHVAYIPDLLDSLRKKYKETKVSLRYRPADRKGVFVDNITHLAKYDEVKPYVSDLVWDKVVVIEQGLIYPTMIDITLDVESEDDSLFVLDNQLAVLNCSGQGEDTQPTRRTMVITNNSIDRAIPLVVGRRVAQILFFETDPLGLYDRNYAESGKHKLRSDLEKFKKEWRPYDILPKQWLDREALALNK